MHCCYALTLALAELSCIIWSCHSLFCIELNHPAVLSVSLVVCCVV